jgi:iron complex outermembrane receptor protein
MYRQATEKVRWQLGASFANHADYRLPKGQFALNTRFNEAAAKSVVSFSGRRSVHHLRYSFNQTWAGIPGESEDSTTTPESFWTNAQDRRFALPAQLFINQLASSDNKWFSTRSMWQLLVGFTSNRIMEFEDERDIASMHMTLFNTLYSLKWMRHCANDRLRIVSGLQGMHQWNFNAPSAPERLIPDSRMLDQGGYVTVHYGNASWNVQGGIRYDMRRLDAAAFDSTSFIRAYNGFNASLGAIYRWEGATIRASLSSGYRAPHLTELLSNGFHHSALRYELGDSVLQPEYARQADVTAEITGKHLVLVYNPFMNVISNYIALQPLGYSVDGMPAFAYRALSEVLYYGNDVGVHYHPHFAHNLHLETTWSYIRADSPADSSVSLLPPQRLQTSLKYSFEVANTFRVTELNVMHTYMAAQRQVAFMETPSAAYHVVDAAVAFEFWPKSSWQFRFGVRNVLNDQYIDHLSRLKNIQMPAPGRNMYVSIQYRLRS